MNDAASTHVILEKTKKTTQHGAGYWTARALMQTLEYDRWENFEAVLEKAKAACGNSGVNVQNHFLETTQMVGIGSGAERKVKDFWLSRYACYLVAMNGDPTKPVIAAAQTYFAVQTRRQEIADSKLLTGNETRIELRDRVTNAHNELSSTAKHAGIQDYALFYHAGYQGFYRMSKSQVKAKKKIAKNDELLDCVGSLELSALQFKAELTKKSIEKKGIKGQKPLEREHQRLGEVVRDTVHKETGTFPENLPAEPSIKKLTKQTGPKQISPPPEAQSQDSPTE
jgi:DNA-damage-inducible protein D